MRGLMILVGVLSVLLVAGGGAVVAKLLAGPGAHAPARIIAGTAPAVLDEPAGSRIVGATVLSGNLAIVLQGGGPDRVLVLDGVSGREVGRVALAR